MAPDEGAEQETRRLVLTPSSSAAVDSPGQGNTPRPQTPRSVATLPHATSGLQQQPQQQAPDPVDSPAAASTPRYGGAGGAMAERGADSVPLLGRAVTTATESRWLAFVREMLLAAVAAVPFVVMTAVRCVTNTLGRKQC